MNRFYKISAYCLKVLWTSIAVLLVLFALFISFLRYSLPLLDEHTSSVESFIQSTYNINLSIESLSADWSRTGPQLILNDITVLGSETTPLELQIGEINLEMDFWASLVNRKFISHQVLLKHLYAEVQLDKLNRSNSTKFPVVDALENIFLVQLSNFSVASGRLVLVSKERSAAIDINSLYWLNEDNLHQGNGLLSLKDFSNDRMSFIIEMSGDVDSYEGMFYANARNIDLANWLNKLMELDTQITSSSMDADIWARIGNGQIREVVGEIKPLSVMWSNEQDAIEYQLNTSFQLAQNQDGWGFSFHDLSLDSGEQNFVNHIDGIFNETNGLLVGLRDATQLGALLPFSRLYSEEMFSTLSKMSPEIQLESFSFGHDQAQNWFAQLTASSVSWQAEKTIPGIDKLSVSFDWYDHNGRVNLRFDNTVMDTSRYFNRTVNIDDTLLPIYLDYKQGLIVSIPSTNISLDNWKLDIGAEYSNNQNFLSLFASADSIAANQVKAWLPKHLLRDSVIAFLTRAFPDQGSVDDIRVLYHGVVTSKQDENFNASRLFQADVKARDLDMIFSSKWPMLQDVDVELSFENKSMVFSSQQGQLNGVRVNTLNGRIDRFSKDAELIINADVSGDAENIAQLFANSPLAKNLGKVLNERIVLSNQLNSLFELSIPVAKPTKSVASGEIYFNENTVNIVNVGLNLHKLDGSLSFNNQTLDAKDIKARLFDQNIILNLDAGGQQGDYSINVNTNGVWDIPKFIAQTGLDLSPKLEGETPWHFTIGLDINNNAFAYTANLYSDLIGLRSDLPLPMKKSAEEGMPLHLKASGEQTASKIDVSLGQLVRFDGAFAHEERQFNRAYLNIGESDFETRGLGFSISSNFDEVNGDEWLAFVNTIISSKASQPQNRVLGIPERIFVNANRVHVKGEILNDFDATIKRNQDSWEFDIDSNELRATTLLYDERFSKGLQIDAEYLKLPKSESEKQQFVESSTLDPKVLPLINFTCKSCDVYGYDLGRIELLATPNNDGLEIESLTVKNRFGITSSSGQWYKRNDDHYSFLAGDLYSSDFGKFLDNLGLDSGIQDSEANINFALKWDGSPMQFKPSTLDGELSWRLTDGSLTAISDKGSRLFTLLSLNSLVRKLSLDFRDVFAKGFFYEGMNGSIQIIEGRADTRDTFIDGAAGDMEIYGYTDFTDKSLNYNVSFAPNVTGNLPVLVYFFTVSPPSAIAALALDQVLSSTKVISNVNYSITGTIDEPIMIETGRDSTEVELPARKEIFELSPDNDFIPPTEADLLNIEPVNNESE